MFENKYPYTNFHELNLDFLLEQVQKLQQDVTTLIEQYKDYEKFLAEAKEYTDEEISKVRTEMAALSGEISATSSRLSSEIARLENVIDTTRTELQTDIDVKYIRNQQAIAQQWEDTKQYIADQVIEVKVRNFFTGALVSIQSMFDYLAGLHLTDAGTYAQVSNNNTYQHYVDKDETYTNVILSSLTFFNS